MKVKEQSEKLIIIDDCTCLELDTLDYLAYSRLSGDGALLIHTQDFHGLRGSTQAYKDLVDLIKGSGKLPDAFILLRR